jgi:hypothetical protein
MASVWVELPQVGAIAAAGRVALRLSSPEVIVTYFVTDPGILLQGFMVA